MIWDDAVAATQWIGFTSKGLDPCQAPAPHGLYGMIDFVMAHAESVIPRSEIMVGVAPTLRTRLTELAAGRPLVLDYFASRTCSIVIGDLTAAFRRQRPGSAYVELASIGSVQVFAEQRLLPVLKDAALTLRLGGPTFARHLAVSLDPGSRWIEFLEQPGALTGKRRFRR